MSGLGEIPLIDKDIRARPCGFDSHHPLQIRSDLRLPRSRGGLGCSEKLINIHSAGDHTEEPAGFAGIIGQ